ncbi:hypothetical protein ACFQ38_16930 [Sporosarcina contaminans]|uniref:Uncharacterized protein n=1 Tax=Sporosarcina contaminans TaxID=633403 RepID=A0ABW3U224_9BACL
MKRFLVFIVAFAFLHTAIQIASGWVLTAFYTPDLYSSAEVVRNEVTFGSVTHLPFIFLMTSASIAYLISQKVGRRTVVNS